MKSARHQLILLGFLCQGLAWDGYWLVLFNTVLWIACLTLPQRPVRVSPWMEILLMIAGVTLGTVAGTALGQNNHFAIGHGITMLQAARLLRPLDRREQAFSLVAASMQIGVACTTILDYRFILLALAAVMLIPRALSELSETAFADAAELATPLRLGWKTYAVIACIMVGLFITFPRGLVGTPISARPSGANAPASLLDTTLDPTRGGTRPPNQVILQIEGEKVDALRCYALVDFIDGKWTPDQRTPMFRFTAVAPARLNDYPHRRVRVKNVAALGRVLPTDGRAVAVTGQFFRNPLLNGHGMIECDSIWNSANNIYDYWIDPHPPVRPLRDQLRARCLAYPAPSPKVRAWLDERVAGRTNALQKARALEAYLRDNFTYRLGAPELDRVNQLEDFLINQREGHCERFASSLALLLRMEGIPSRVILGFVPGGTSPVSNWRNVRFRDAHAWTEAYFDGLGWISFDATPRSGQPSSEWDVTDLLESVDAVWYSQIVNYDSGAQHQLLQQTVAFAGTGANWLKDHPSLVLAVLSTGLLLTLWTKRRSWQHVKKSPATPPPAVLASQYYGRLLRLLARHGFHREPQQTPHEFLLSIPPDAFPEYDLLVQVTDRCCTLRYGDRPISAEEQTELESKLRQLEAAEIQSLVKS